MLVSIMSRSIMLLGGFSRPRPGDKARRTLVAGPFASACRHAATRIVALRSLRDARHDLGAVDRATRPERALHHGVEHPLERLPHVRPLENTHGARDGLHRCQ